jgi:beta-phosphoglucomutase-like phosphatase (HAD superfamily)
MKSHFERYLLTRPHSFREQGSGGDGRFHTGRDGVLAILTPADGKVEFICFADKTLCYVKSAMGYPALYPVEPVRIEQPLQAVLMDLDGTSVHSEGFWIWIIERTTAQLLKRPGFELEEADLPYVSGHSVSEHLQHCISKYCPDRSVEEARAAYFEIVHAEMEAILQGRGRVDAFKPAPGLKRFLTVLKERGIKIGLVTSGLYEKAWPEIVAAFRVMGMGDPRDFYDAIITAGNPLRGGEPGTLGELAPKPHPWLYAETARVGLGVDPADRHHVMGIEDSAAGVISLRLAGFSVMGMEGGNIEAAGVRGLCERFCRSLEEVLDLVR